jgi:hypothetical protein
METRPILAGVREGRQVPPDVQVLASSEQAVFVRAREWLDHHELVLDAFNQAWPPPHVHQDDSGARSY